MKACCLGADCLVLKRGGFPDGSGRMRMHALPLLRGLLPCVFLPPGRPLQGPRTGERVRAISIARL